METQDSITDYTRQFSDCTSVCDEQILLARDLVKVCKFDDAIDILLQLEKYTRTASDMASCTRVLLEIVNLCTENGNWEKLCFCTMIVTKKRNLLKESISKMVQECMKYVDSCPTKEEKLSFIETLRTVTEGKIYLEVERARLTKILADMKEAENDIEGAAAVMNELKIESYGKMEKRERVELLLQQIRLCLLIKNTERAKVISKKVPTKVLEEPEQEDLKMKFYNLLIELEKDSSHLMTSRYYQNILNCSYLKDEERKSVLKNAVAYCVLASFDNEQSDLMQNLYRNKLLDELPIYKTVLELFTCKELIDIEKFAKKCRSELNSSDALDEKTAHGKQCWKALGDRLIEHNIFVLAQYYTKIYLQRMSELLRITEQNCEEYISALVNTGKLNAKIDRPSGIVSFKVNKNYSDVLNEWTYEVNKFMDLVNKTCHLINREMCLHEYSARVEDP